MLQQHGQRRAYALAPLPSTCVGGPDLLDDTLHSLVKRREKTLFAILEHLIERAPRHPRTLADTPDSRVLDPDLAEQFAHRPQQTTTLHLDDMPTLAGRVLDGGQLLMRAHTPPRSPTSQTHPYFLFPWVPAL